MSLVDDNGADASEAAELVEVAVQGWLIGWESGRMVSVPWTLSPSRFKRIGAFGGGFYVILKSCRSCLPLGARTNSAEAMTATNCSVRTPLRGPPSCRPVPVIDPFVSEGGRIRGEKSSQPCNVIHRSGFHVRKER